MLQFLHTQGGRMEKIGRIGRKEEEFRAKSPKISNILANHIFSQKAMYQQITEVLSH
jgi:hypothetical protein